MASLPFTGFPVAHHCRFDSQPFRLLLLRRLWLPLPSTVRSCRCGLPLDSRGHHRTACSMVGVAMRRRGFAVEIATVTGVPGGMDLARPDVRCDRTWIWPVWTRCG